jgi:hypothetical protein
MFNSPATACFRRLGGRPAFRIYVKARPETDWRVIDVFASHRRSQDSRWPRLFWRGTCITWTAAVIEVGWDFAEEVPREQVRGPASREHPVAVIGGRIRNEQRRRAAGGSVFVRASEILADECGHTWQMLRLGAAYWPLVGAVTLFREGPHWWNHFENQASELGLVGGIVNGSVSLRLQEWLPG